MTSCRVDITDFLLVFLTFPFCFLVQKFCMKYGYGIGRFLGDLYHGKEFSEKNKGAIKHFASELGLPTFHSVACPILYLSLRKYDWFLREWVLISADSERTIPCDFGIKFCFMLYCGFHLHDFYFAFFKITTKDYWIHHITALIICVFAAFRFPMVTTGAMFHNGFQEIIAYTSKLSHLLKIHPVTNVFFVLHLLTWMYFKNYLWTRIVWAFLMAWKQEMNVMDSILVLPSVTMVLVQFYWLYYFLSLAYKLIQAGDSSTIQLDDEHID